VAVIGNPNTGKSTLFNSLTGLRQEVGNYPGVTVEKHVGRLEIGATWIDLVDLPGTYSMSAHSLDEMVAVDVLAGRAEGTPRPDAVVVVVDATNLRRNLFLVSQIMECGLPVVVALNMIDLARRQGIEIDAEALSRRLGVGIVPTIASGRHGLDDLRLAIATALASPAPSTVVLPQLREAARSLQRELAASEMDRPLVELERALIDVGGAAEHRLTSTTESWIGPRLQSLRRELGGDVPMAAIEARARYAMIGEIVDTVEVRTQVVRFGDRIDRVVNHPIAGSLLFLGLMTAVFQAVFAWAAPIMDLIDAGVTGLGSALANLLPDGALASLLVDGIIGGVGAVLVFLPQIVILFAFIILLEDTGYMARAAFLMDRMMRACGLSGHSFIPMLSSFACAVPGIMATRVIRDRRDRLATILAAPFMTCSARLPIYALLIAAFVPRHEFAWGIVNAQGLVLLALYLLGIAGGVGTAWLLKRSLLRGPAPPFLMELPPYRWPSWRSALIRLFDHAKAFVVRAGTYIFVVSLVVWALAYFPRSQEVAATYDGLRRTAASDLSGADLATRLQTLDNREASDQLAQSFLGRAGHLLEPLFAPLGWDWKVSAAVVASFPAREVVVAVLGTTYAVGSDVAADDTGLVTKLRSATHPDGSPVYTLPVALGIMVFFAFCLQCVSTLAIMRRETNSWRWPAGAWLAMTTLAWVAAWFTVHISRWWIT
jgi:ferrous iron transport protein B